MNCCPHGIDVEEPCESCDAWCDLGFGVLAGVARCTHPRSVAVNDNDERWCPGCGALGAEGSWELPFGVSEAKRLDDDMRRSGAYPDAPLEEPS
jgi:hypothetical protein